VGHSSSQRSNCTCDLRALCDCRQLIPRDQLRARNDSLHGYSTASTLVVCNVTAIGSADTVKWHSLCTCICVDVCVHVRRHVMYVRIDLFVVNSTTLLVSQTAARCNNSEQ
jgi:hypothetical protein